jgi:hypothetical protein
MSTRSLDGGIARTAAWVAVVAALLPLSAPCAAAALSSAHDCCAPAVQRPAAVEGDAAPCCRVERQVPAPPIAVTAPQRIVGSERAPAVMTTVVASAPAGPPARPAIDEWRHRSPREPRYLLISVLLL